MNRYGLFCRNESAYAIPLERLMRVLSSQHCYRLPMLPGAVSGVVVWEGQLIPLLDLARLFYDSVAGVGQAAYQVLISSEYGIMALSVEQTFGIIAEQNGKLVAAADKLPPGLKGEFCFQGRIFQILDIDCLVNDLLQEPR